MARTREGVQEPSWLPPARVTCPWPPHQLVPLDPYSSGASIHAPDSVISILAPPTSWPLAPGPRLLTPGSWLLAPGSRPPGPLATRTFPHTGAPCQDVSRLAQ